jgi:hypothetical protein
MSGKNQHVVPHNKDWAVKGEGNSKATVIVNTQQEAIDIARDISQNQKSELFIHNRQGQIRERDSHGHDPKNVKG